MSSLQNWCLVKNKRVVDLPKDLTLKTIDIFLSGIAAQELSCVFFQRSWKHLLSILCKSVWSGKNRTLQGKMGSALFEPLGWFKCCSSKLSFWLRGQKPQIKRNLWITIFNWKYQKWLERSYHLRIVIKSPKKIQQVKKVRKLPISLTDIFLRRGGFAENKNGVGKGKYLLRRKGEKRWNVDDEDVMIMEQSAFFQRCKCENRR